MVNVRQEPAARFNVLLTEDRPRTPGHWTLQVPRLLEPQGVVSYLAHTGREAVALAGRCQIHAAVLDLATPVDEFEQAAPSPEEAGLWLIELFRRLPNRPPIIIIHNAAYSQRLLGRIMNAALRVGAFSMLGKPVDLEQLLTVFQRLVEREYSGAWPRPQLEGPSEDSSNS